MGDGAEVLLGQNLGGGHERGLPVCRRHRQDGGQGDQGLAATNLTLEQAAHGRRATAHVLEDLGDAAKLGASGSEGETAEETVDGWGVVLDGHPDGVAFAVSAAAQDGQLEREDFVEGEAAASTICGGGIGRIVNVADSVGQRGEAGALEHVVGQRLRDLAGGAGHGQPGEAAEVAGGHALGEAVDRGDAAGVERGLARRDDVVLRGRDGQAAAVDVDLAVDDHVIAGLQGTGEVALAEPLELDVSGVVGEDALGELEATLADVGGANVDQFALDGEGTAGVEVGDAGDFGAVIVATREHVEEVANGAYVQLLEALDGFGIHAAQGRGGLVGLEGIGAGGRRRWRATTETDQGRGRVG